MPGIFGIISPHPVDARFRAVVRDAHAVPGLNFAESAFESPNCVLMSISRLNASTPCAVSRPGPRGAVLLLEGEIFNRRQILDREPSGEETLADHLLKSYLSVDVSFVESIDGEFNIVIFEPAESRLSVFNDHAASCPFYYWNGNAGLVFGSEKKCVLAATDQPRELDPVGLLQPFVHQHNLEDRTFIDGLRRMRPGTRLTCEAGKLHEHAYRAPIISLAGRTSVGALLEEWERRLSSAVSKRISGKSRLLISLSAGQDSRAAACAIDRSRRPIFARTWGHRDSLEVRYAKEIAAALSFDQQIENPLEFRLSDGVRQIVWRTDGETDFRNGLSMFTHARMRVLADDVIGGWLGDITSGAHLRPFMLAPLDRRRFVGKVFNWYIQHRFDDLRQVFTKAFLDRNLPGVRQAFVESFRRYEALPNSQAYEAWDLDNRQTRMTVSSMPVDSHLFGKVRPFFDKSYMAFAASIPVRWRFGQSLYKALINRIGPEIRHIPNANTNIRNFRSPCANLVAYGKTLGDKVAARLVSKLQGSRGRGRSAVAAELARHEREDTGMRRLIDSFMASRHFDGSIFDRTEIQRMLERHYSGAANRSELISILATYAVAMEYFYYERPMSCPPGARPFLQPYHG